MTENKEEKILAMLKTTIQGRLKEKGMSMAQLVREIEMTEPGFYKMLENGSIKVKTLVKIADVLQDDVTSFFQANVTQNVKGKYNTTLANSSLNEPPKSEYKKEIEHKNAIIQSLEKTIRDKEEIIELLRQKR